MSSIVAQSESTVSWAIGYSIAVVVVLVVVALVVPILLLAKRIGDQAGDIDEALGAAVDHTSALAELSTTIESAGAIVAGLERGRTRLGG